MKKNTRLIRINEEIQREISDIIQKELKDPRIGPMTSVTGVETTNDLKYAKVYVSMLGSEEEKKEALQGLKNAAGFVRREVAQRINLRNTPEIQFYIDQSVEYGIRMNQLIKEVTKKTEDKSDEI